MKKIKSISFFIILGLCFACISIGHASSVFAAGSAEIVDGPNSTPQPMNPDAPLNPDCSSSTSLSQWRIDCAGVSWVFYRAESPERAGAVKFPYISGNGTIEIPATCAEHGDGGFWHYGVNLNGSGLNTDYGATSFTIGAGTYGHWSTRRWGEFGFDYSVYKILPGGLLNQSIGNGLYVASDYVSTLSGQRISKVGDRETVLKDFIKAWNYKHQDSPISDGDYETANQRMNGVGTFCFWESMDGYSAKSNVGVSEIDGPANDSATTEIVQKTDSPVEASISTTINKEVQIIFSHNPYSSAGDGAAKWKVVRTWSEDWCSSPGECFTVSPADGAAGTFDGGAASNAEATGDITSWSAEGDYYVGNPRNYSDGSNSYALRDAIKVKFNEEDNKGVGTWKFCEEFIVYNDEIGEDSESAARTTVCANVEVTESAQYKYYSVSNASNSASSGWATTGITNVANTKASTDQATIKVGDAVTLTFSHNVYSDLPTGEEKVNWCVTRDNLSSNLSYTISTVISARRLCNNDDALNEEELGMYTISDSLRQSDGYGGYYAAREQFKVTFRKAGTYEFCEKMNVGGNTLTIACTSVKVLEKDDQQLPKETKCGDWTPASYNTSMNRRGYSHIGTTSILSKVNNPRLTEGNGHYGGWLGDFGTTGSGPVWTTYAMPTDIVNWTNCYYPGVQYLANKRVVYNNNDYEPHYSNRLSEIKFRDQIPWTNQYSVKSSTDSSNGVFRVGYSVIGLPNTVVPPTKAFMSTSRNGSNPFELKVGLEVGDVTLRESSNSYKVLNTNDAGKTYTEIASTEGTPYKATISYGYHTWYPHCCCSCSCPPYSCCCSYTCDCYRHRNRFEVGNYAGWSNSSGTLTTTTKLIVPYNFQNTASFSLSSTEGDLVYAGDKISVRNAKVEIGERNNAVTEATYTTQVDNAEARLIAFVSSNSGGSEQYRYDSRASSTNICDTGWLDTKQCMEVNKYNNGTTKLNPNGELHGFTHEGSNLGFDGTYNVFDASAGDYMCFVIAVFPWRSGPVGNDAADKTTNPAGTESSWLITAPQCKQIAKKPTMQVLGGNVFTNGSITTENSTKHNLYNLTEYRPKASGATIFGSFAEDGITANGLVTRFASGAAMGRINKNSTNAGYGAPSARSRFCNYMVPLTIANYTSSRLLAMCGGSADAAGYAGVNITTNTLVDRSALVDYFIPAGAGTTSESFADRLDAAGTDIPTGGNNSIKYVYVSGGATISESSIATGATRIVKADSVQINGNIKYSAGSYTKIADVPKAVIYSAKDIHIGCGVEQVDAILIANGTVYTCGEYAVEQEQLVQGSEGSTRSQSQLVINGVIIADKVEMARTYGSAAGEKSGLPAEVLNYDTSAILWERYMAGSSQSDTMTTVYQHELAPRY
ncbi:hypothetical protein IJ118_00495 [Candidatus Saccharibacteria bacterium]|nr:hypothetical protein [Candidatus Saccharibacteria bacterium]